MNLSNKEKENNDTNIVDDNTNLGQAKNEYLLLDCDKSGLDIY